MNARDPGFIADLAKNLSGRVGPDTVLARYSTYRIGGPATVVFPAGPQDVAAAVRFAGGRGVPVFPIGLGSNLLLPDEGMTALVLRLGKGLDAVRSEEERWWLGAGLPAPLAARSTAERGWAGLHVMVGVPGTVGGGVFMNAGCHGGQWSDVTESVTVVDRLGESRVIAGREIPWRYRKSGLEGVIVVEAAVRLRRAAADELAEEVRRLYQWRQEGTPFNQPCCGSVFQNPAAPKPPGWERPWTAGSLLEAAGLKGTRRGGVEVSPMHANYFVNTGNGTAAEVRGLIVHARDAVRARFGVVLEPEVKIIGGEGQYLDA